MNWNFNLSGQTNMNIEAQIVVLIKLDSEVIPTISFVFVKYLRALTINIATSIMLDFNSLASFTFDIRYATCCFYPRKNK